MTRTARSSWARSERRRRYFDRYDRHMVFGGRYVNGELRYFSRYDGRLTDTSDAI